MAGAICSADTFVAQNSAGTGSGSDCADARSASWFNTSSNWGSATGQIGPGATVHLCGTISTALTAGGSGAGGNPVTIVFETGAKISMPACPNSGCLNLGSKSYIVVDGGSSCGYVNGSVLACNGTIESTLNGTPGASCTGGACSYQEATNGISFWGGTGIEIRNLNIWNMYVHRSNADNSPSDAAQAVIGSGPNMSVHNIVAHDNRWSFTISGTNVEIYNISVYNTDHCFAIIDGATNIAIHDNQCYNPYVWDTASNTFHHDGIHMYVAGTSPISGTLIYNNYFWGDWGNNVTAHIFSENYVQNTTIFNNLFRDCQPGDNGGTCKATGPLGNGSISLRGPLNSFGNAIYNNTILTSNCVMLQYQTSVSYQNNISCGMNNLGGVTFAANSNNVLPSGVNNLTGALSSGSNAISAGKNLTSLGISLLDHDRAGLLRPATAAWDAGALDYSGIAPPTALTALVQ